MEIRKYEAFLKSVDLGSFTAAAEELKYTTAGISHMVESIEAELGFPLLRRGRSGVSLTRYGEALIDDIRHLVQCAQHLTEQADALKGLVTGRVVIGAYYSISSNWLPGVFCKFAEQYPEVQIELREGGHQLLNQWMADGQLDLMLTSFDKELGHCWLPLRKDRMVAVLPPFHPLAERKELSLEDCMPYDLIMPARGRDYDVTGLLRDRFSSLRIRLTTIENYSALAMVEQGLGISIMNELITLRQDQNVVKVPLTDAEDIVLGIYLPSLASASLPARRLLRLLLELQSEECRRTMEEMPGVREQLRDLL